MSRHSVDDEAEPAAAQDEPLLGPRPPAEPAADPVPAIVPSSASTTVPNLGSKTVPSLDSIISLPKESIEQLAQIWAKALVQGLQALQQQQKSQAPDLETGDNGAQAIELDSARPVSEVKFLVDGTWDLERVPVMTADDIAAEKRAREDHYRRRRSSFIRHISDLEPWLNDSWLKRCFTEKGAIETGSADALDFCESIVELLAALQSCSLGIENESDCLLGLIGFRLYHHESAYFQDSITAYMLRMCSFRIMVECLWLIGMSTGFGSSHVLNLGYILRCCYEKGILVQPPETTSNPDDTLRPRILHDMDAVLKALSLVDTWGLPDEIQIGSWRRISGLGFQPIPSKVTRQSLMEERKDLERVLQVPLQDLTKIGSPDKKDNKANAPGRPTGGEVFRTDDLDVVTLTTIGKLRIEWTPRIREHLCLDIIGGKPVLLLYWFAYIKSSPARHFTENNHWQQYVSEVDQINNFLFRQNGRFDKPRRDVILKTGTPVWFCGAPSSHTNEQLQQCFKGSDPMVRCDFLNYVMGECGLDDADGKYSNYPILHHRIRELRNYMDQTQPKGWRGLFKDNRNPASYWTFWLVVIFGLTSVILAIASLIVSSLQTWVAYHPLRTG